jgi:hypothetical protein
MLDASSTRRVDWALTHELNPIDCGWKGEVSMISPEELLEKVISGKFGCQRAIPWIYTYLNADTC